MHRIAERIGGARANRRGCRTSRGRERRDYGGMCARLQPVSGTTASWAINFGVLAARRADMDLVYSTLLVHYSYRFYTVRHSGSGEGAWGSEAKGDGSGGGGG